MCQQKLFLQLIDECTPLREYGFKFDKLQDNIIKRTIWTIGRWGIVRKILKPKTWRIIQNRKFHNSYCILAYTGYGSCHFTY